ncbi:MAG: hypothetical protein NT016_03740 [Candidatus Aenigmarchaeota archaeon]|nr:hypothetical protein [Candidatus Aenigmarchaeota archaeon]
MPARMSRGDVDRIAKAAMGYFLSQVFKRYELLQDPLPTRYDVKSAYYARLLGMLRDSYGSAPGGAGQPLRVENVPGLHMASKFDEKVSEYADSILNKKYMDVVRRIEELAAMTDEEKVLAAQKNAVNQSAPPKKERKRSRANPKMNRYR